ncbi:hypothetical protein [Kitasatospora kifunensis]|uniref:PI-PLC Y-box domain-containing protein n=1 Tax=Kitasatospora kifunensis TaxID=58351 RepID=A0A7W7R8H2_KITKI|nr:hypothetical protein [Kitasatospora kifunensis]MBB4927392.1 hypothetical protein [Kitasatospora kifunensis]
MTGPAGLSDTFLPKGAEFPSPHAQGYTNQTPNGQQAISTNWEPSWGWAAGAEISTLDNLHTWAFDVATGTLLGKAVQAQRTDFVNTGVATPGNIYNLPPAG